MKKLFLISAFISFSFVGFGQCPDQVIWLSTQEEVDEFVINYPNCSELKRTLEIGHLNNQTDIINLNGLSQITAVGISNGGLGGNLVFRNAPLTSFSGLESLEYIGGKLFVDNSNVIDLTGLSGLVNIRDGITFLHNTFLVNMEGLPTTVLLEKNLIFVNNPSLMNFQGLNIVDGDTYFVRDIIIDSNSSLQNLNGLEGLNLARQFGLYNNDNLVSIEGVASLDLSSAGNKLHITGNAILSDCAIQMVCGAVNNPNVNSIIMNNGPGCNSEPEVRDACLLDLPDQNLFTHIILTPNPVSKILRIHTSEGISLLKATVYSVLGEELFFTLEETVDFSNLSAGIYFIKMTTDHGSVTKKIVKE